MNSVAAGVPVGFDAPAVTARGQLDALGWAHTGGPYRGLGLRFAVRATDPALGRHLGSLFAALAAPAGPDAPAEWYSFVDRGPAAARRYAVYFGDRRIGSGNRPERALMMLLWHLNAAVVRASGHLVVVHAAGAERDGAAVLLPAPSGGGKTTLVAGLVRAGLRYLTDEAVAIDPATLLVQPFPKALALDPGSWQVHADLRPRLDPSVAPFGTFQWHVPPAAIRPDAVAPAARPRLVVAPRYVPGARTRLRKIERPEMLKLLAESTFNFHDVGRRNLEVLAEVVRGCECYRATVGELGPACDEVVAVLDRLLPTEGAG